MKILREEKELRLKGGLYQQTQVKMGFNSNGIEENKLSEEQVARIFNTNTIVAEQNEKIDIDDIIETINHFTCFDYMLSIAEQPLTEKIIKMFHTLLKSNTSFSREDYFFLGGYKSRPNLAGDAVTAAPENVEEEMKDLLNRYNTHAFAPLEKIIWYHYNFEMIHPFQGGNGQIGRMIIFKECLRHEIYPFILEQHRKETYIRGLNNYKVKSGYLVDACRYAQDMYEELIGFCLRR
ncbi:MAG: Fic family protein [Helicobacteraceae bacterium]|nr:Fic family protein [Helicobacteraceae bacterium]